MTSMSMSIILRLVNYVVFGVSTVLGLSMFVIIMRVASGASFDAYPLVVVGLASSVGGTIMGVGMTLIKDRPRS
jgi:hypothetical protein